MNWKRLLTHSMLCCICILLVVGCKKTEQTPKGDDTLQTDSGNVTGGAEEVTKELEQEQQEPTKEEFFDGYTEEELKSKAEGYAEWLAKGQFSDFYTLCSEALQGQMEEASLKTVWESQVLLAGGYKKAETDLTQVQLKNDKAVANVVLRYEKYGVLITIALGRQDVIEGLWINEYNFEEETEVTPTQAPDEREVEIKIGEGQHVLDGILTLPKGIEQPPVVILVQGSGQSDMDETIGTADNKPFRDIARGLADLGIASIRYNKRYYQYPDLADNKLTIELEVLDDVNTAISFALNDKRLNEKQIYVLGHSLGGMLAPKIAADNEAVAGIISMAGSPRGLEDIIYDQNSALIKETATLSEQEREELYAQLDEMITKVKEVTEDSSEDILQEPVFGVNGYYWRSLNEINIAEIAKELRIPMLFLQGDADFQIYADVDFKQWEELLQEKDNVTFHLYSGLNHLFMKTNGLNDISEYNVPGTVEKEVISDIAQWMEENSSKR